MNRPLAALPSVDRLLRQAESQALIARHGRPAVTEAIRAVLADLRAAGTPESDEQVILARVVGRIERETQPLLRPVFNLTGTVLHTNLGRALLPEAAIEAVSEAMRSPVNLEFDLESGRRGERDAHVERWLCRLTGAEAAAVVNNNAAAVLLVAQHARRRARKCSSRAAS